MFTWKKKTSIDSHTVSGQSCNNRKVIYNDHLSLYTVANK